jgi:hypothetical protein
MLYGQALYYCTQHPPPPHPGFTHLFSAMNAIWVVLDISVPDHDGGRPKQTNACILITHMVYL